MNVLIAGASGAVGKNLLQLLLPDERVSRIDALLRSKLDIQSQKLNQIIIDFDHLNSVEPRQSEVAFCCLGTTMKKAGSKENFRKVDQDYIIEFAQWAHRSGVHYFHLISALGANANSGIFYNKVKGETEIAVKEIGFKTVCIYKPSLLVSKRKDKRIGERIGIAVMHFMNPLLIGPFRKYRSIDVSVVAQGMYARMVSENGSIQLIESDRI
jgi:uncharacterized protein YbjT (DUF2867 family)